MNFILVILSLKQTKNMVDVKKIKKPRLLSNVQNSRYKLATTALS